MGTRRTRSTTAVVALLLAAGTTLAGCGGGSSSSGTDNPASKKGAGQGAVKDPSKPVTISFFSWIGNDPNMKKTAAKFHQLHPNITIKFENVPADNAGQVLTTRIAGNNAPDVAFVNASDTADYAARGALVDLSDYIGRSDVVKPDDYTQAFKTFVTYDNKMWGLPIDGETTGLFYRTDLFKAAGIDHPPTTWDEFQADAAKLTIPSKDQYGYELFASEAAYYWYPWLYQAGGDLLSADGKQIAFTSDAAKKAADFYVGLAKYAPKDYLNSNSYDGRVAFEQGQVGMYMAGAWFAGTLHDEQPKIDDKWATAPLPEGPAGCKTTIAGDALIMPNQTKNSDAAWLWMEYLSRPEQIAKMTYKTQGTLLPPLNSLLESDEIVKDKPVLKGFIDLMKCGVASTVSNPKFPRIETILNDELGKAMYGQQSGSQALENAAQQGEAILSRG